MTSCKLGLVFFIFVFFALQCSDNSGPSNSGNGLTWAPQPAGIRWTYREIGTQSTFSIVTEHVDEKIGNYAVYRLRRSDSPPGLGNYIGYEQGIGEVWVASDSWDPTNPADNVREVFQNPTPVRPCPHGMLAGTTVAVIGDGGPDNRVEYTVLVYEPVSVPYGTFQQAQKLLVEYFVGGVVDNDNMIPTYQWQDETIGLLKEIPVTPTDELGIELIGYYHP